MLAGARELFAPLLLLALGGALERAGVLAALDFAAPLLAGLVELLAGLFAADLALTVRAAFFFAAFLGAARLEAGAPFDSPSVASSASSSGAAEAALAAD
ncbi:MAG TPA: hypothetical protein VG963_23620, partial [Polyangiaceae bacterium]|nr:hypothetical protein [Polyangiaceae bacterium]